jgi:energy-converting hydrogenase Eha subunit E
MWFLAGVAMLVLGVATAIASGGESRGALTPANVALAAAVLSLLILPAERSVRR